MGQGRKERARERVFVCARARVWRVCDCMRERERERECVSVSAQICSDISLSHTHTYFSSKRINNVTELN